MTPTPPDPRAGRPAHPDPHGEQHETAPPPGATPRPRSEPRSLQYHALAGSQPQPAGRVLAIGAIALLLAAVLNADGLFELANRQPVGWKRDVARAAVAPVCAIGDLTRLKDVRSAIRDAADKDSQDCSEDVESGSDAFVAPSTTATTTTPSGTTAPAITTRVPTAADPLRMWLGGDSMTIELEQSAAEAVTSRPEIALTTHAQVSSGLTRPDFFDWPAYLTEEVLPGDPEVVVVMFGANDSQGMEVDGEAVQPDDERWQAEYRRRVGVVMDLLKGDGRLVVWVGQPRMRDEGFDARMGALDAIYEEEAASRPWVRFLDSRPVLSPDGGEYQATAGDVALRQGDGIHLDRGGADLLADAILEVVDEVKVGGAPPVEPPG
ncbi:DUF459 domain-containing protein [Iamia sp. SCSIO 61187]|uniref:SGNH/GDSL hydrolase family protein n=1 Tax=Iamia sp. SCSIO 61187 TaxID=2722752 RepID=UPI001C62A850|nr:DUF459 domain-containing protein [Iamia sp. SCSIO 61187]QYG93107.1 DUF459 domain-containing protein [Iamia sp. SCSIO 61187]